LLSDAISNEEFASFQIIFVIYIEIALLSKNAIATSLVYMSFILKCGNLKY
jgi:hypothetical protein